MFESMFQARNCLVQMTSVMGHLMEIDLLGFKDWKNETLLDLFSCPCVERIRPDLEAVASNLRDSARHCQMLVIFTDCDREGEKIGQEIASVCREGNRNILVKRARFSIIQQREIFQAWNSLQDMDEKVIDAVDARMELDLKIGAIFTRLQTVNLRHKFVELDDKKTLSYGPCQFPTLGFIVERYLKAQNFVPEAFWSLNLTLRKDGINTAFTWDRGRVFDHDAAKFFHAGCLDSEEAAALITKVVRSPKSKWAPYPLTTIEMQKIASRVMKMSSDTVMEVAESLYREGIISYPRTETDQFGPTFQLHPLIQTQSTHPEWGRYAHALLAESKFRVPRRGQRNDEAHPPIHPVKGGADLKGDRKRLYDFIARRFLACCSHDARGDGTTIDVRLGAETFQAKGLVITERNFLEVYPFEQWSGTHVGRFSVGERVCDMVLDLHQGATCKPAYLTESDLIGIMDKSGIGTDATIHEHIKTILKREYALKQGEFFIPTTLGMSLVMGYDKMDTEISLSKPELRALMEKNMNEICAGTKTKTQVVQHVLGLYRDALLVVREQMGVMEESCGEFMTSIPLAQQRVPLVRAPLVFVRTCVRCGADMHLKHLGPRPGETGAGKWVVGCSGYPTCTESKWVPGDVVEAVEVEGSECVRCTSAPTRRVLLLRIKFKRGVLPMHLPNPYVCCLFCRDADVEQILFSKSNGGGGPTRSLGAMSGRTQVAADPPDNLTTYTRSARRAESTVVNCGCGMEAACRTSGKAASMGRVFYVCPKQHQDSTRCSFFQWQDDDRALVEPQQQLEGESSLRRKCNCGLVAAVKTSTRENENKGKQFLTCPKSGKSCGFFEWIDASFEQSHSVGVSAGPSSHMLCFKCNQPGHFSNACPGAAAAGSSAFTSASASGGGSRTRGRGRGRGR